ncbi:hypothetical protein ACFXI8_02685 [Streptomyces niveus]|uniref:ApeA N-terminal domain 1-containing protein n=1 Tax=Streptomyces niveus TaxID=193462 RepID=UPI00368885AC
MPFFDQRKDGTVGRMRDTAFVRVVPAAPFSLDGAREAASLVQDLISLATHRAAGLIWLRLGVAETEPAVLPDGRPAPKRRANVLYPPTALGSGSRRGAAPRPPHRREAVPQRGIQGDARRHARAGA